MNTETRIGYTNSAVSYEAVAHPVKDEEYLRRLADNGVLEGTHRIVELDDLKEDTVEF